MNRIEPLHRLTELAIKAWLLNAKDKDILVDIAKFNNNDSSHTFNEAEKHSLLIVLMRVYDEHGEMVADWIEWAANVGDD